jgi:UPF0755 protein
MKKKQRLMLVLALLLLTCGLVGGFAAWTIGLNYIEPLGSAGSPSILFVIKDGESTAQIGDDLVAQKIISNALAFRLWARYKGLDHKLQAGAYRISASMTIPEIVTIFLTDSPVEHLVTIPEGDRIWQMAAIFAAQPLLQKFNSATFIKIAQTGTYTDTNGKSVALSSEYWFLNHDQQNGGTATFALEGYLFPDSYLVDQDSTAPDLIHQMLNNLGEHLCPGPQGQPDIYLNNEQQCEAHPALDPANNQSVFALLKQHYTDADGKSMADKLDHALTLSSIVQRETRTDAARQGVTSVYYNRYLVGKGELTPPEGGLSLLQADPTLQYALGTPNQPWPALTQGGANYHLGAYDTYQNPGLPPGPICSAGYAAFLQSIDPAKTNYFYFITGADHQNHYATTSAQQQENINKYGLSS